MLSNHFYIGEVKYKREILPGEQPPIMDRALFEAVRQKSLAQWSHRTIVRNKSDHLLTGLLFDDAGHRMIPTHATKADVRYRYYVSTPVLHGEAKTASAGSVSRVPAADIEDVIVKSLKEHLVANLGKSAATALPLGDRCDLAQLVAGIVVDSLAEARHPKDPAGYYSRTTQHEVTSGRSSLSAGRAWSALSPGAAGGSMMLSQAE